MPGVRILHKDNQAVDDEDGGAQFERVKIHTCLRYFFILANRFVNSMAQINNPCNLCPS